MSEPLLLSTYIKRYHTVSDNQKAKYEQYVKQLLEREVLTDSERLFLEDFSLNAESAGLGYMLEEQDDKNSTDDNDRKSSSDDSDDNHDKQKEEPTMADSKSESKPGASGGTRTLSSLVRRDLLTPELTQEYARMAREFSAKEV